LIDLEQGAKSEQHVTAMLCNLVICPQVVAYKTIPIEELSPPQLADLVRTSLQQPKPPAANAVSIWQHCFLPLSVGLGRISSHLTRVLVPWVIV
jgi:hypothetical protein